MEVTSSIFSAAALNRWRRLREPGVCLSADAGAEPLMELLRCEESSRPVFLGKGCEPPSRGSGKITQKPGLFFFLPLLLLRPLLSSGARAGGAAEESMSRSERPNGRLVDLGLVIITGSPQCGHARGTSHHGTPAVPPAERDSGQLVTAIRYATNG